MPSTQGSLFSPPQRQSALRVGPAGWNYKDWEGIAYPAGRSADALSYLADYFDTIEINSSFYAPPRAQAAASWARRVQHNPHFRFTAKAWQRITHDLKEDEAASLAEDCDVIRRSMAPLMETAVLGALLIQFPWSFRCTPENQEYLSRVFRQLREFPLVVEVRHAGWDQPEFYDFLGNHKVAFCNVDQPVIGQSIKPGAQTTSQLGYFRLHGRNYQNWFKEGAGRDARYDYLYTKEEVCELSAQIRKVQQNTAESYAITNNHFRGQALVNAVEILEELDGARPEAPPLLAAAYPGRLRG
jgi:uncharacterized protein YecE (DUF72 family)